MSKLNLNIKLKHIRELEKSGRSLGSIMNNGVLGICDLMNACGKTDEEVEAALKEYGPEEMMILACEELQEAGFLPRTVAIRQMMESELEKQSQKLSEK